MSHDTWLHRLVRPAVRPFIHTPLTPNHLTTLRLVTGLAAAAALAHGGEFWRALGAGVFVLSVLLDRSDGELARLSGKSSPWGHKYDLVVDAACNASIFIGLGVGLRDTAVGEWSIALGAVAGAAVALVFWLTVKAERRHGQGSAGFGGASGFDPDDAMLVVPVAIWLGAAPPLLIAAAIGAPTFAVFIHLRLRRSLSPPCRRGGAANAG